MKKNKATGAACPCGAGKFEQCCARYIVHNDIAPTAEALMRSRYSAYTLRDDAYLQRSWHASTRPQGPLADAESQWIGLELKRHTQDGDTAIVEFIARYKRNGRAHRMHEVSRFVREEGQWLYVEAIDG